MFKIVEKKDEDAPAAAGSGPFDRCSYCFRQDTSGTFRLCKGCRTVRYCSRGCERGAAKAHKPQCSERGPALVKALDEDAELRELNTKVDTWLRYWRPQLFNYAFNAINLANNSHDRMATHIVFIELESRKVAPTPQQAFKMRAGEVMTREEFMDVMRYKYLNEGVVAQWAKDKRGEHTIQVCVFADWMLRNMFLTMGNLDVLLSMDKEQAARVAEHWADALRGLIDRGEYHTDSNQSQGAVAKQS